MLKAFGQAVRECRSARGFSQEGFAHYCGLDTALPARHQSAITLKHTPTLPWRQVQISNSLSRPKRGIYEKATTTLLSLGLGWLQLFAQHK
ncbi:XRE family transcriptional regulator [Comamonas testosteroni ATCC 11996]|nr:XRE family transcriptional regulator [Comamonas testosteroni ATCC 11996]